jgi:hypothetical protein
MRLPTFKAGEIEQAIYTWSSRTVSGTRGHGFGAVSPGLIDFVPWLESIGSRHFELLNRDLHNSSEAYDGWREFVGVGFFRLGEIAVAYRKYADGGEDPMSRPRHTVHLLVGARDEIDIQFALCLSDSQWLKPEDCRLDRLPVLETLSVGDIDFDYSKLRHDCAEVDEGGEVLVDELVSAQAEERELRVDQLDLQTFCVQLLATVPVACLRTLDVDSYVGREGPVSLLRTRPHSGAIDMASVSHSEGVRDGLSNCRLFRNYSRLWSPRLDSRDPWPAYRQRIRVRDAYREDSVELVPNENMPFGELGSWSDQLAERPRGLLKEFVEESLGNTRELLQESHALKFLRLCNEEEIREYEILNLSTEELRVLFGGIESRNGFVMVSRILGRDSGEFLRNRWIDTSLGVLGFATLQVWNSTPDGQSWRNMVPRSLDRAQLGVLLKHLSSSDEGIEQLGVLLACGFAADRPARRAFLELTPDGSRLLFTSIVPHSALNPEHLLDLIRENFDAWAGAIKLSDKYAEAIKPSIMRRTLLGTLLRRPR